VSKGKRLRGEIITFRLSKKERELYLERPAEILGVPNSDLIRMALRSFATTPRNFGSKDSKKPQEEPPAAEAKSQKS
jgi:hypothetical protein